MKEEDNNIENEILDEDTNQNNNGENNNIINEQKNPEKKEIITYPKKDVIVKGSSELIYIDKATEIGGKTVYHIKGNMISKEVDFLRRYRDFDLLRSKLVSNWPGIIIPPIPPKKIIGSLDQRVVDERLYVMEQFLKKVINEKHFMSGEELQHFINDKLPNSELYQASTKKLKTYTLQQISENYTKFFGEYRNRKKGEFTEENITSYTNFINNFRNIINQYKSQLIDIGEIRKNSINRETRTLSFFSKFEKSCIIEYVNNDKSCLFFAKQNTALNESVEKYNKVINNPFLVLSSWIRLKDLELSNIKNTFGEYKTLLNKKKSLESKQKELNQKLKDLDVGKKSFLDKILSKDTNKLKEKYNGELYVVNNEVNYINNIISKVNDYLSVEVPIYFEDMRKSLYKTIKKFAIMQNENCILASDLWLKVQYKSLPKDEKDINIENIKDE